MLLAIALVALVSLGLPDGVLGVAWPSIRRSFGLYGTDLGEQPYPDPPAHYFGVPAVPARSAAELAHALTRGLAADHPTVIEAKVDPRHYLDTVYD